MSIKTREQEQLFFILIQNAIEVADPGTAEKLTIECQVSDQQICFNFTDTCCGIPPEKLKNLFQPFYSEQSCVGGGGMSLAVAQRIISAYGGNLKVTSEVDKGSTFQVILPLERLC
ncbi:MAG: sensor histidine kinase [Sedimentisphaerales bacterium]|nr:sensor histidine kinase [Sedimentisphaerales bacterium]